MKKLLLCLLCVSGSGILSLGAQTTNQNVVSVSQTTISQIKGLLVTAKSQLASQATKIDQLEVDNTSVSSALASADTNIASLQKQIQDLGNDRDKALYDKGVAEQKQAKAEAKTAAVEKNMGTVLKVEHLLIGLITLFIVALLLSLFKGPLKLLYAVGPWGIAAAIALPLVAYATIFATVTLVLDHIVKLLPIPG